MIKLFMKSETFDVEVITARSELLLGVEVKMN